MTYKFKTADEILADIDTAEGLALSLANLRLDYADHSGVHSVLGRRALRDTNILLSYWNRLTPEHRQQGASYELGTYDTWDNLMRVVDIRNRTYEKAKTGFYSQKGRGNG